MTNEFKSTCIVWTPKYATKEVYCAVKNSKGEDYNYVVICCNDSMNGIYRYPASNVQHYDTFKNGTIKCYAVPIKDLEFYGGFDKITSDVLKKLIRQEQQNFIDYMKHSKPDYKPKFDLL